MIRFLLRRRQERLHRAPCGAEAPQYTLSELFEMQARGWDERRHVKTTLVYDEHGEPVAGFNSRGIGAVWPFDNGAPE
ncbi:hypothetical protein BMW24_003600 [Mycobacterium heckeshornense]|uniref:hypothetical protein n=1 Tax=Mycobacterium heckeshornense TaxID=110505 RepID=UPI0008FD3C3D|nr:hypothetical protein [Mycobacterium heckeshornense]PIJ36760.1 hypothetical protein BMW24_003315 [Mycobacterium heckeshornense]PIJ36811.1 hypothetical protein BMW24_003600 [Mycobacterium heckeshornense]